MRGDTVSTKNTLINVGLLAGGLVATLAAAGVYKKKKGSSAKRTKRRAKAKAKRKGARR
jgi:hypothetical protein